MFKLHCAATKWSVRITLLKYLKSHNDGIGGGYRRRTLHSKASLHEVIHIGATVPRPNANSQLLNNVPPLWRDRYKKESQIKQI